MIGRYAPSGAERSTLRGTESSFAIDRFVGSHPARQGDSVATVPNEDDELIQAFLAARDRAALPVEVLELKSEQELSDHLHVMWLELNKAGFAVPVVKGSRLSWSFTGKGERLYEALARKGMVSTLPHVVY